MELSGIEEEETLDTSLPAIEQETQAPTSDSGVSTIWTSENPKEIAEGKEWGDGGGGGEEKRMKSPASLVCLQTGQQIQFTHVRVESETLSFFSQWKPKLTFQV